MKTDYDCFDDDYGRDRKCKSIAKTPVKISTPIKIEPIAKIGRITKECGKPEIYWNTEEKCNRNRACEFVIKQTIYVEIPLCYDVETEIGESYVDCR